MCGLVHAEAIACRGFPAAGDIGASSRAVGATFATMGTLILATLPRFTIAVALTDFICREEAKVVRVDVAGVREEARRPTSLIEVVAAVVRSQPQCRLSSEALIPPPPDDRVAIVRRRVTIVIEAATPESYKQVGILVEQRGVAEARVSMPRSR